MDRQDGRIIRVQSGWSAWQTVAVPLLELRTIHWRQPVGAPRPLVHGYVSCGQLTGQLPHDCEGASRPHDILVCVLKTHTAHDVYAELERRANGAHTSSQGFGGSERSQGAGSTGSSFAGSGFSAPATRAANP